MMNKSQTSVLLSTGTQKGFQQGKTLLTVHCCLVCTEACIYNSTYTLNRAAALTHGYEKEEKQTDTSDSLVLPYVGKVRARL